MIRFFVPLALAAVTACSPGLPRLGNDMPADPMERVDPTPQPTLLTARERLVRGIEDNGCELTTDNVSEVLRDATISQQELLSLTPQLEAAGRVEVSGSGAIRVLSDRCI